MDRYLIVSYVDIPALGITEHCFYLCFDEDSKEYYWGEYGEAPAYLTDIVDDVIKAARAQFPNATIEKIKH